MRQLIRENKVFLGLYLLFLIIGAALIIFFEKGNEILYFNKLHTPFFDKFFVLVTRLAELPILLFIIIVTVRFSYGKGLVLAINSLLVFVTVTALKYLIFADQVRPSVFFEGKVHLNFVQNLEILREHSFPSGHTAGAFALLFMLSLITENKKWSILLFAFSLLVAISRVYLLEHFFRDVYAGSIIGTFITACFYLTFVRSQFYERIKWKDKKLIKW